MAKIEIPLEIPERKATVRGGGNKITKRFPEPLARDKTYRGQVKKKG